MYVFEPVTTATIIAFLVIVSLTSPAIIAPTSTSRMDLVIWLSRKLLLVVSRGGWSNRQRIQSGVIERPSNRAFGFGTLDEIRDVGKRSRVILLHGDSDACGLE